MYDVAVVGAGLPGLTAAWRLALGGLRVAVFERRTIASESSALAAGHVPQRSHALPVLRILRRTRELVSEVSRFEVVGGLIISRSRRNRALFDEHVLTLAGWGVDSASTLEREEITLRWPELRTDDIEAALYCSEDGLVRSLDLAVGLAQHARAAGVAIYEGCPVERLDVVGASVRGVVVAGRVVPAPRVVLAAGAWSGPLARASGLNLPLRQFTLSAVMLLGVPVRLPFLSDLDGGFYVVSRSPDAVLLGLPPRLDGSTGDPTPDRIADFARTLASRVPTLQRARVAGGWTGLLVGTPDAAPRLGPHPELEGLHLATGFAGGGVQWVSAAEAVAQVILEQPPFFDMTSHMCSRFSGYNGEPFDFPHGGPYFYDEAPPHL